MHGELLFPAFLDKGKGRGYTIYTQNHPSPHAPGRAATSSRGFLQVGAPRQAARRPKTPKKGEAFAVYPRFLQTTMPRVGQAALAVLIYLYFLHIPLLQPLAGQPVLFYGLALAGVAALSWWSRNPLGPGIVAVAYFAALAYLCWGLDLLALRIGPWAVAIARTVSLGGLTPGLLTVLVIAIAHRRARRLYVTRYTVKTEKPLPGGRLRIVQLSDLHPNPKAALHRERIPELKEKIDALQPDLILLTGDVYDEFTPRAEFDAFNRFIAELEAPLGKYLVYGNHDLFHHLTEPEYDRADMERAMAAAHVRVLEDVAVDTPGQPAVRLVGRKDYLFTKGRRAAPDTLCQPDGRYTIWLDHEPRELKQAAAAGADLILCGHTHGGQIWPSGYAGRVINEMNYGRKQVGAATAITSGGTGTWGYRLRTQGKTEIVFVDVIQE